MERSRSIPTDWIHGLTTEEKVEFEQTWRNSTYVLDRLKQIIDRSLKALEIDNEDDYEKQNWPVVRAHRNGRAVELNRIRKLLP